MLLSSCRDFSSLRRFLISFTQVLPAISNYFHRREQHTCNMYPSAEQIVVVASRSRRWCRLMLMACVIFSGGFATESLSLSDNCVVYEQNAINSSDDKQKWMWDPSNTHPCNIRRVSRSELHRIFGNAGLPNLYPSPLIIYPDPGDNVNAFENRTTIDNLHCLLIDEQYL